MLLITALGIFVACVFIWVLGSVASEMDSRKPDVR